MVLTLKVNHNMTDFLIKKLPYDLSAHAGLAFIGKYLKRINVNALIDPKFPVRSGASNSDIAFHTGLMSLPWTLKPFWSPLLEMFRTKKFFVVGM